MKLLTSSPSSTLSFDPTLSAGCITRIFHRIFCSSGGLQTHPSEQIREIYSNSIEKGKVQELKTISNTSITSSPGIVARLMGLDSMAEKENEIGYEATSRIKNDVPAFELHENENFLVFSFESGRKSKELKSRGRRKEKSSLGRCELKKKKREKVNDEKGSLRNEGEFQVDDSLVKVGSEDGRLLESVKRKEVANGEKMKRKKGKVSVEKKVESECCSEDSSPVSVFDFERDAPGTAIDLFGDGMGWRRKLSSELENDQHFALDSDSDSNLMNEERNVNAIENNVNEGSKKKEKLSQECVDIWDEICKLVEDELVGSNQLKELKRKQSDIELEEISADFESEIFDHLLDEVIDQLVGNPLKVLQI